MRALLLSLLASLAWVTPSFAQQAAPGSVMVDLKVPSITQPLLPVWYNITFVFIALVAVFFVFVLYRTIKDKTYTY
jgi:sensor histidine kinase regulating citrate/malate metabolism